MRKAATFGEKLTAKGRQRTANTTLGEEDVRAIREARESGIASVGELADFYDISPDSVRKIVKRERFRWVLDVKPDESGERGDVGSEEMQRLMAVKREGSAPEIVKEPVAGRVLTPLEQRAVDLGLAPDRLPG